MAQHRGHPAYESPETSETSETETDSGTTTASDDREELIERKARHHANHHQRLQGRRDEHRHAHSHKEMNLFAIAIAGVAAFLLVVLYYWYGKNTSDAKASATGADVGSVDGVGTAGVSQSDRVTGGVQNPSSTRQTDSGIGSSSGSATVTDVASGSAPTAVDSAGAGRVVAFFENWKGIDPATVDFTGLYAAFWFTAVPQPDGSVDLHESLVGQAKIFAEAASNSGTKPMLTVGGWSGSAPFSKLVSSSDTRVAFVDAMVQAMNDNSFEGLDIDWEYPARAGATEDFDVEHDLANLLLLLQEIRDKIGKDKLLSIDTSAGVYNGADGTPSKDMSEFGEVLDFLTIMTYDAITYSSKTTGPNFSYSSKCDPGSLDIPGTVQAWIDAKFPAQKISVGLTSYGYAWQVDDFKEGGGVEGATSSIYQTSSKTLGEKEGAVTYDQIRTEYLSKMDYTYDNCTSTPFLYSSDTKLFIAYDDEKSFAVKGGYAKEKGLMGYMSLKNNRA